MGFVHGNYFVKLFCGIMFTDAILLEKMLNELESLYGQIERRCGPFSVDHFTNYYSTEMGHNLQKVYVTFSKPIDRDTLSVIKHATNDLEKNETISTNRSVNIDPGYLSRDKFVLASTKDFYHRISIGNGIYAEVTLHYRHGKFRYFSWTYPDYKIPEVQKLLEFSRAQLVSQARLEK